MDQDHTAYPAGADTAPSSVSRNADIYALMHHGRQDARRWARAHAAVSELELVIHALNPRDVDSAALLRTLDRLHSYVRPSASLAPTGTAAPAPPAPWARGARPLPGWYSTQVEQWPADLWIVRACPDAGRGLGAARYAAIMAHLSTEERGAAYVAGWREGVLDARREARRDGLALAHAARNGEAVP